jgi:hypothetical protein
LQLTVGVSSWLSLNANSVVGATEGIAVYQSDGSGGVGTQLLNVDQGAGTNTYSLPGLNAGTYFIRLVKFNSFSYWGTYSMALAFIGVPVITSPSDLSVIAGEPINYTIAADGNPESFGASGLPPELNLNPATGLISGTLSNAATYPVTLYATNALGVGSGLLTIRVLPRPSLSPELLT